MAAMALLPIAVLFAVKRFLMGAEIHIILINNNISQAPGVTSITEYVRLFSSVYQ